MCNTCKNLLQEKRTLVVEDLAVRTVRNNPSGLLKRKILVFRKLRKSPLAGDKQLLSARELVLGTTERLKRMWLILLLGPHTKQSLANLNSSHRPEGLPEGAAHACLQAIGACTREHFVDTKYVEWVGAYAEMEGVLSACLGHVLVAGDTCGFESLRRELLLLVGHEMGGEGKFVDAGRLATQIEDADLRVRDTAAVAGLRVRLVLAVTVATRWT